MNDEEFCTGWRQVGVFSRELQRVASLHFTFRQSPAIAGWFCGARFCKPLFMLHAATAITAFVPVPERRWTRSNDTLKRFLLPAGKFRVPPL
jgi:hypothetical protein